MDDKVYIVTAGCYSDYHIEAVFKEKSKAEFYCSCHKDCDIEEYNFSDNKTFTPFESVTIYFDIFNRKVGKDKINFNFSRLSKEDGKNYLENRNSVYVYGHDWISIVLHRRLPNNYDEQAIRSKYTKVCQDLRAEISYLVQEHDCSTFELRMICGENIEEYIKDKFGIEEVND